MKTIAVFAALVAVALAAPQQYQQQQQQFAQPQLQSNNREVYLLKETPSNNIGLDGYQFAYEQSDGQKREESSQIEVQGVDAKTNEPIAINRVRGSYSFPGPDGIIYTVNYVADENGFRAEGAHLPKAL